MDTNRKEETTQTVISWEELLEHLKNNPGSRAILVSGKVPDDDLRKILGAIRRTNERIDAESVCGCPDCRMKRLYKEYPAEAEVFDNQWSMFQSAMLQQGKIICDSDGLVFAIGPDEIRSEAEKFGLDERILDVLLARPKKSAMEMIITRMIQDRVGALNDALSRLQKEDRLHEFTIGLESGKRVSLQEASKMREEIPPEVLAVIDKYVGKSEPEAEPETTE